MKRQKAMAQAISRGKIEGRQVTGCPAVTPLGARPYIAVEFPPEELALGLGGTIACAKRNAEDWRMALEFWVRCFGVDDPAVQYDIHRAETRALYWSVQARMLEEREATRCSGM